MSDARGCRSRWTDPVKEGGIDVRPGQGCRHQPRAGVPLEGVRGRTRWEGSSRESHGGRRRPRARGDLILGAVRTVTPPVPLGDTGCRGAAACASARGRRGRHAARRPAGAHPSPRHFCGQRRRGRGASRRRSRLRQHAAEAGGHPGSRFGRVGRKHTRALPSSSGGRFWLSECVVAGPYRRQCGTGRVVGSERDAAGVPDGSGGPGGTSRTPSRRDGRRAAPDDRHRGLIAPGSQSGPPSSGAGGSTGSPAPAPPGSGSPTAPVVVGNTVTTVGSPVTTSANHVASNGTAVAPATGALGGVGTTVTGLGQRPNSTTA